MESSFTTFISALQTPKLNQESCDVLYFWNQVGVVKCHKYEDRVGIRYRQNLR